MTQTKDIDETLDSLLRMFTANLNYRLNGHLTTIYMAASAEMTKWAGLPYEGPPIRPAIDYAGRHCAQLVTGMNEETKRRLAQIIGEGIENKRGVPGLARDIRKEFTDMSKYRSELISRTETCDALEQAFMDRAEDMNIEGKEWVTFDPCPICEGNGAEGIVPIDHVFGSGHLRPPAHPACRCALAPARLSR